MSKTFLILFLTVILLFSCEKKENIRQKYSGNYLITSQTVTAHYGKWDSIQQVTPYWETIDEITYETEVYYDKDCGDSQLKINLSKATLLLTVEESGEFDFYHIQPAPKHGRFVSDSIYVTYYNTSSTGTIFQFSEKAVGVKIK